MRMTEVLPQCLSLFIAAGVSAIAQTGVDAFETIVRGEKSGATETLLDLGLNFSAAVVGNCFGGKIFPTNAGWFQPQKISSAFAKPYGQKILLQTALGASLSSTVNFARKNNWNKFVFIVPALP